MTPQRRRASQRSVADGLFAQLVKIAGCCEAEGVDIACKGNLQCAHVFSRSYLATRFSLMNAMPLCAAHHLFWTLRPIQWEDFCRQQLGSAVYQELRRTALKGGRPEYPALIADLRARLEASAA